MSSSGFHEWVRRAQEGDEAAMRRVFERIRPFLDAIARELIDSARASRSASDLVQEAEIRAWRGLDGFLGGQDDAEAFHRFRKWIEQILRNVARNVHRERNTDRRRAPGYRVLSLESRRIKSADSSSHRLIEPAAGGPTASQRVAADERVEKVREAIARLWDSQDRAIVQAYYFETPNLSEIARRLEIPYAEVRERYKRTMALLERMLDEA